MFYHSVFAVDVDEELRVRNMSVCAARPEEQLFWLQSSPHHTFSLFFGRYIAAGSMF
jgi:hypothetical protein